MKKVYIISAVVILAIVVGVVVFFATKKSAVYKKYYNECIESMAQAGLDDKMTHDICHCMSKKLARAGELTLESSSQIAEECLAPLFK